MSLALRALVFAGFFAIAAWLAAGAGGFLMIDQGDYTRTVARMVEAPIDPVALPHSKPVGHAWRLAPVDEWKLRLYRGSATSVIAVAALPAALRDGVFDTRRMAAGYALAIAIGALWAALLLAGRRRITGAVIGTLVGLPIVLAAHNAALLGSFYGELALLVALPYVLVAMLLPPGRGAHLLLFGATAVAAMAKAPFFYLPTLVAVVLWCSDRLARPATAGTATAPPRRRGAWIALGIAQLLALAVPLRGEFSAMNAHHATFLGSDYGLDAEALSAAGLPPPLHHCVGVDFWGNHVAAPDARRMEPRPAGCEALPPRHFGQAIATYLRHPLDFARLTWRSFPVHVTADYFHVDERIRYRYRTSASPATRLLEAASAVRDRLLGGLGYLAGCALLLLATLAPWGRRLGAARAPIALMGLFATSQWIVSLLGEGVRDLGKHMAAGQYALDLSIALLLVMAALWIGRGRPAP